MAKNGSWHWWGGIQHAQRTGPQSGRRRKPSRPRGLRGPRVGNRRTSPDLTERAAASQSRDGRVGPSGRDRQLLVSMKYALLSRTFRSGGTTTLGPGQIATGRVVWSCGVLSERVGDSRGTKMTFAALSGLLWAFGDSVETVETSRDCGDIVRLLVTWHGVQSGSRRKAEFEWVGMVSVGLGRRTDIAQTVGVGRE